MKRIMYKEKLDECKEYYTHRSRINEDFEGDTV